MKFLIELDEVSFNECYENQHFFIEDLKRVIPSELGVSVLNVTVVE